MQPNNLRHNIMKFKRSSGKASQSTASPPPETSENPRSSVISRVKGFLKPLGRTSGRLTSSLPSPAAEIYTGDVLAPISLEDHATALEVYESELLALYSPTPNRHPEKDQATDRRYYIVNVQTRDYVTLLSDSDRWEVVNTNDNLNPGSGWVITHIKRDEYSIQNTGFESFACYDNRPEVGARVLGKWEKPDAKPSVWRIKSIPYQNDFYTISPLENPDIFWMSLSNLEGTPLELGKPWTAADCQWVFKGAGSNTKSSPIVLYEGADGHVLITQLILEKLPIMGSDPIELAFKITTIVLETTAGIEGNLDTVDRRIASTAAQFRVTYNALTESNPRVPADGWLKNFINALNKELNKLYQLRDDSTARTVVDPAAAKRIMAEIFDGINDARAQFELAIDLGAFKKLYEIENGLREILMKRLQPSWIADHKYELEGQEGGLLCRTSCTPGTRLHILDAIGTWARDASPDGPSVYWLFGPAGSGKSTIAYTVAQAFSKDTSTTPLGGNFFCSRQFEEAKESKRIIRTIAYQLALICKPFADTLNRFGQFDTVNQNVQAQIQGLLVKPWQASKADRRQDLLSPLQYLVVIDALDEIAGGGGSKFLRYLFAAFNDGQLSGLKILVTSRPDPGLVAIVHSFKRKQLYHLQDVDRGEVSGDIRLYLMAELPDFASRDGMETLVTSADGLFIYAATVVRYLEGYTASEQEELLEKLLSIPNSGIPRRSDDDSPLLDQLYIDILTRAFHGLDNSIRARRLRILHVFLCTAERTSETVVAQLLCDSNRIDSYIQGAAAVLEKLHAVLYVKDGRVLSYHKSFSDLVFDQSRSQTFWCDQEMHHQSLTKSCFQTMNAGLKFNIVNIKSSYILDQDNIGLLEETKRTIPDVLSYSCRNWSRHLCFTVASASSDPRCHLLSEFLQLQALFWIEAMNLLRVPGQCDPILRLVADWVKETHAILARKLGEAANFALYFSGSPATSSTPHLYISALATWPGRSQPCVGWKALFPRVAAFRGAQRGGMMLMSINLRAGACSLACSTDGSQIVSGLRDRSVRVWNASRGELVNILEGHTGWVNSVAYSTDGSLIVSGSSDTSVRVWNASMGELLSVLDGHTGWVNSAAFSPDGGRIVSGARDRSVRVWATSTGQLLNVLDGHNGFVNSVAYSVDGSQIVSGSHDKSVRVWNASTGELLNVIDGHTDWVNSVTFSTDGSRVISGSRDRSVRIWNASTGDVLNRLDGHTDGVCSVAYSSDDSRIVSGSSDKSVRIWNASAGELRNVLDGHSVKSVAVSTDGSRIVSSSDDALVRVFNASTGDVLHVLDGQEDRLNAVAFSSDGSRIVSRSFVSVRVWNTSTGELVDLPDGHTQSVNSIPFMNGGRFNASGSDGWNRPTGELREALQSRMDWINAMAYSTDGSRVVTGSGRHSLSIWNALTGDLRNVLYGHTDQVNSVAFSTDGSRIISGSSDSSVRVWSASTSELLNVLDGHTESVESVSSSIDGSRIVSCSSDRSVRVWDTSVTPRYLREHEDRTYTGWLLSPTERERLMFVPIDANLPDSSNVITIPLSAAASIDFTGAALGLEWQNCYIP